MDAQQQLQVDANPSVDTNRAASGPDPVDAECFTVVTYNILSSALASPDWFRNCDPRLGVRRAVSGDQEGCFAPSQASLRQSQRAAQYARGHSESGKLPKHIHAASVNPSHASFRDAGVLLCQCASGGRVIVASSGDGRPFGCPPRRRLRCPAPMRLALSRENRRSHARASITRAREPR